MRNIVSTIRQSLSLKLSFGILLLAIPIFVASLGILFVHSRHHIKNEAQQHSMSLLSATMQRVSRHLKTIETATNVYEWLATEYLVPDSLLAFSNRIVMMNANVSGCSITTEPDFFPQYGRYFSAYSIRQGDSVITVREGEYEYFDKVWYATPRELGKPVWVDPFDDYNEGTLSASDFIASYCKPLFKDGRFVGVISSDLSLNKLSEVINGERPYPNAYFVMLGKDGHYFVHPDTSKLVNHTIFGTKDNPQTPELIALGHKMTTGLEGIDEISLDGTRYFVCYRPIADTPWSIALACPESDVLKSHHRLTNLIVPLIIIGLLLILLFCRQIVGHAISPLNRLLDQSQLIASGNYEERIPHSKRQDAVGQLQNSFVAMQDSLEQHVNEIQQKIAETEQRNQELARANEMAKEADRQKTAFIQNMSHQIRTPLNIIMGVAQVIRDSDSNMPAEEMKGIADMMSHSAMTLSRLVLMLYDSSDSGLTEELGSHRNEEVACNDIARECIENTRQHFPDIPIKLETTLPDSFTIHTNGLYLMRSLREILYNSAKYSDGQHIAMSVSDAGDYVRFVFEDTGKGIADDYRELVFIPFSKVDDLSQGLGLGLPLSKRHVDNLGGRMMLDPDYKAGCRIIIEIPKG